MTPSPSAEGRLWVVAGAPGSGKTAVRPALRRLLPGVVVVDLDDFLPAAGRLAGVDLASPAVADRWPAYNDLCLGFVATVLEAGHDVLLLAPLTPGEVARSAAAPAPGEVRCAVLDCSDATRRLRLAARPMAPDGIEDAVADAAELRALGLALLPNDGAGVEETARSIARWATGAG